MRRAGAALALAWALTGCDPGSGPDAALAADQVPLMEFTGLSQTGYQDGKRVYTVQAATSRAFPARNLVELKDFVFQEYDAEGQPAARGQAEEARIDTSTNNAVLSGTLTARSEEQKVTLRVSSPPGEGLTWTDADRVLSSGAGGTVRLTKDDGSVVTAHRVTLDLGSNLLTLEGGLEGTWTAKTDDPEPSAPGAGPPGPPQPELP